jgi:acyl-coenzyme A synthetase/AMP-(fatty) acid ligase
MAHIHYLERKDRQIKVNGQRVELGDIEYALIHSLPNGTACAVETIRPDFRQNQEVLAAFIDLPNLELEVSGWSLMIIRKRLLELLPLYMTRLSSFRYWIDCPLSPRGRLIGPGFAR